MEIEPSAAAAALLYRSQMPKCVLTREAIVTQTEAGCSGNHGHFQTGQSSEVVHTDDHSVPCMKEERLTLSSNAKWLHTLKVNIIYKRHNTLNSEDLSLEADVTGCQGWSCDLSWSSPPHLQMPPD